MKSKILPIIFMAVVWACGAPDLAAQTTTAPSVNTETEALLSYQDEITVSYLKKHLSAFAADSMEGRETGTRGLNMAADYLAREYKRLGLKPVGDNNTYFQHYDLSASRRDSTVFETYRMEEGKDTQIDRSVESGNTTGNYIRAFGGTDTLSGEIVFAGFGVNDAAHNVKHLGGMDMRGKWVLVFRQLPTVVDGDTLLNPRINAQSRFSTIMGQTGAEGMLLIPSMSDEEFQQEAVKAQNLYGGLSQMGLAYRKGKSQQGFSRGYNLIHPSLAAEILGLDGPQALEELRSDIIADLSSFSPRTTGHMLKQTPFTTEEIVETKNVAAFLEGADPKLKDEVVVVTSHFDHVGIGQPDSTGDRIYNGADDDGSGTIGTLSMAKALTAAKANGVMTRRSVLFVNVSGEEKGLLGSRYYSDHPIIPVDKMVANINTDMIGRIDPEHEEKGVEDYSYIIGGKIISSQLDSLLKAANARSGNIELSDRYNDLNDPNQFYRRSDHWNFGRLGIPFVFFFTGVHEDYHRPSDEVEKIRFEKMAKIVRTMYATTVMVANADKAPEVDNQEFIEITKE